MKVKDLKKKFFGKMSFGNEVYRLSDYNKYKEKNVCGYVLCTSRNLLIMAIKKHKKISFIGIYKSAGARKSPNGTYYRKCFRVSPFYNILTFYNAYKKNNQKWANNEVKKLLIVKRLSE